MLDRSFDMNMIKTFLNLGGAKEGKNCTTLNIELISIFSLYFVSTLTLRFSRRWAGGELSCQMLLHQLKVQRWTDSALVAELEHLLNISGFSIRPTFKRTCQKWLTAPFQMWQSCSVWQCSCTRSWTQFSGGKQKLRNALKFSNQRPHSLQLKNSGQWQNA